MEETVRPSSSVERQWLREPASMAEREPLLVSPYGLMKLCIGCCCLLVSDSIETDKYGLRFNAGGGGALEGRWRIEH